LFEGYQFGEAGRQIYEFFWESLQIGISKAQNSNWIREVTLPFILHGL